MTTFNIGDVVQLKTGGLKMTVCGVRQVEGADRVTCVYSGPADTHSFGFSTAHTIRRDEVDARALVLVAPQDAKPPETP